MVINRDHYINDVLHEPGAHELTLENYETDYVVVGIRTLVDPTDADDVLAVHALQDQIVIEAGASRPFTMPDYDEASLTATRDALLELSKGIAGYSRSFGRRADVDPVRHLVATASGWGGLPETEAFWASPRPADGGYEAFG
jgi:hypothetical protein